jgi:hypothetical protein
MLTTRVEGKPVDQVMNIGICVDGSTLEDGPLTTGEVEVDRLGEGQGFGSTAGMWHTQA